MKRFFRRGGPLVAVVASVAVLVSSGTAQAVVAQAPATYVPYLTGVDNYVYAADVVGGTTYVGGVITQVHAPATNTTVARSSLFGYASTTGVLSSLAPSFNGPVWGITHSPDNRYLYVGGSFNRVNGVAVTNLVRFDLTTGALDTGFRSRLNGMAQYVAYYKGMIVVGGRFTTAGGAARTSLASLDPTTGNATSYINIPVQGTVSSTAGGTGVRRFAINPAGTRLVAIGNFTSVAGQTRWRAFMLDLGATSATLDAWNAPILMKQCASSLPNYLWDVKFSPDGSYFAFASTGFASTSGAHVCDAVSKWQTISATSNPVWVNYTGGDSLYAVAITADAVYIAGHERWADNPFGHDTAGAGAVSRPGIAAIDPVSGKALSWNPTRSRGKGAKMLLVTAQGLLVGSDCSPPGKTGDVSSGSNYFNFKFHPCLALAPGV